MKPEVENLVALAFNAKYSGTSSIVKHFTSIGTSQSSFLDPTVFTHQAS